MTEGLTSPYPSAKRSVAIALLGFLVLTCVALVISAHSLRERIDAVRAADSDNLGWLISQLDVDYKAIQLATNHYIIGTSSEPQRGGPGDGNFDEVRYKFDIFYSRVDTVLASLSRFDLSGDLAAALNALGEERASLTETIEAISTPDGAQVHAFAEDLRQREDLIRSVTTMSLQYQVGQTKTARTLEKAHLQRFWLQSMFLLALMISASLLALRLWSELEKKLSVDTARLGHNFKDDSGDADCGCGHRSGRAHPVGQCGGQQGFPDVRQ